MSARHKPREICGALRRAAAETGRISDPAPCGGTFGAAIERLNEQGQWVLGMGGKMRHSPSRRQCRQCGRICATQKTPADVFQKSTTDPAIYELMRCWGAKVRSLWASGYPHGAALAVVELFDCLPADEFKSLMLELEVSGGQRLWKVSEDLASSARALIVAEAA